MLKHLQPLQISEEMLGAYLEGNLSVEEMNLVESILNQDDSLIDLIDEVGEFQQSWLEASSETAFLDFGQDMMNFILPEVPMSSFNDLHLNGEFQTGYIGDSFSDSQYDALSDDDIFKFSIDNNDLNLN